MSLKIKIGEEYKIKIENVEEFEGSIFKDLYTQAAQSVKEIVVHAKLKNKNAKSISNDDYNNIIAFTGERGTGKSSCMISFADALNDKCSYKEFIPFQALNNISIHSLDIIDPSLFRKDDSLFEIIISKMFSEFQSELKNENNTDISHDDKRNLIQQFQKVFDNLKVLHNGKHKVFDKEAIEALSDLAYGTNLKSNFKKLVDDYLKNLHGLGRDQKGFLLISIDDFDLNISGAYKMMEDIRQFLIQSNVIILIACKMEQLHSSISTEILKEYEIIFQNQPNSKVELNEDINDKTEKFIDKLFPIERRCKTPELVISDTSSLELCIVDKDGDDIIVPSEESKSAENIFHRFIFKTTGLVISTNRLETSIVLPNTLRELSNSIAFLNQKQSLETFKTMLIEGIKNNLKVKKQINFFVELEKTSDERLNQSILNWIGELFNDNASIKAEATSIKRYYNATFGEVHGVLREFKRSLKYTNIEENLFINYLFIYYSIRYKYTLSSLNANSIKDLWRLTNGRIDSNLTKRLPQSRDTSIIRDYHEIGHKPNDLCAHLKTKVPSFNKEMYFWLCNFFCFLGDGGKDYTRLNKEDEIILNRTIRRVGSPYTKVIYSPTAFLLNILNPEHILRTYFKEIDEEDVINGVLDETKKEVESEIKKGHVDESKIEKEDVANENKNTLYYDLVKFRNQINTTDYLQIFNISIYNEFVDSLYFYAASKDSFTNDGERIYKYIVDGIKEIADELSAKYHIDMSILYENPFIKFWEREANKPILEKILTYIYDQPKISKYSDDIRTIAQKCLSAYEEIFLNPLTKKTRTGTKTSMTNLTGNFNNYPEIKKKVKAQRDKMNTKDDSKFEEAVNNIYQILTEIDNG